MHKVLCCNNAHEVEDVYESGINWQEGAANGYPGFEAAVW